MHADERALLVAVAASIRSLDPDVLVGWNVVDFDLRTWAARCRAHGLPDGLGRVDEPIAFQVNPGFTRQSRASVPGRMVLDGIALVRDAVRLEDYRLETAARALLGRGKLIDRDVADKAAEIERMLREDPEALVAYNREDARLVLEILEREGLLALAVERSLLSGMPLDRVGASIASFDRLALPELRRRGLVAPSSDPEPFVFQSSRGTRTVPAEQCFTIPGKDPRRENAKAPDEILTAIHVPAAPGVRSVYASVKEKAAFDWPLVSTAVALRVDGGVVRHARIVLGAVAPVPLRSAAAEQALIGKRLNDATVDAVATAAVASAQPLSGNAYKVELLTTLLRRTLKSLA